MTTFHNIEELTRCLDREKKLLNELFQKRTSLSFRYDYALELTDYKNERIQFLIENEVIRESGDYLEMEDIYLQFFEEVLQINEEINVSSVRDYISHLKENIGYWLNASENNKYKHYNEVRRALKRIALSTEKNVIDLKRNIDIAYKNEPDYKVKKKKLENLDEKRKGIAALIDSAEKVIAEENTFFTVAMDSQMRSTVNDAVLQMKESYHNLIEIERQIISYLNIIEYQNLILEKARKLKYLKDQLIIKEKTNIMIVVRQHNPVMFEPETRTRNRRLSLERMHNDANVMTIICKVLKNRAEGLKKKGNTAEAIPEGYIDRKPVVSDAVNLNEIFSAFAAVGNNLFRFLANYRFHGQATSAQRLTYFCQIASLFPDSLSFTGEYEECDGVEYPVINAK